jgi:hypothetical protein
MMLNVTTKLEVDCLQSSEVETVFELASIYNIPAIVVHQDLVPMASMFRSIKGAKCKIIIPVDSRNTSSGMDKLRGLPIDALNQDGMEITISGNKPVANQKNEMLLLTNFIRTHLSKIAEVRFVVGTLSKTEEEWKNICGVIKDIPAPDFIRTDIGLRVQQNKASAQAHNNTIQAIKSLTPCKIKLCGNISSLRIIGACKAARYGVNLKQLQSIITELKTTDKDRLREIFSGNVVEDNEITQEVDECVELDT